jgi:hypothetical protein
MLTIFGYSAPTSDAEAIGLMQSAWGKGVDRTLIEVEIVDIKVEAILHKTWKPFIYSHHYRTATNFYESTIGCYPRRSCDATWTMLMDIMPVEPNPVPQHSTWHDLYAWFKPLFCHEKLIPSA